MQDFVHLHLHTQYSLLDGAADINRTLQKARDFGMEAVAITDHGTMYAAIEFYEAAKSAGIKPIIGCEVYTAPRSRFNKDAHLDKRYGHLVLLCKNEVGYRNLMKLVTLSNTEGFYYKPRVDMELLRIHSDGLIALSGCLRGDVATAFLNSGYDAAVSKALEFSAIFGKDNFFLEIQNHGLDDEATVREGLSRVSEQTGIGLVATNDVHYVTRDEAMLQDVLTCIQTGKKLSDTDRMKMEGDEYYFKNREEMEELFSDYPEALTNSVLIAKRCNLEIDMNSLHLPGINIDSCLSHSEYLRRLCIDGMMLKYGKSTPELMARLEHELDTINSMGYTDYFLIVHDFIKYSKDNAISVGPGRGSAAGSLVSYCLNITEVDPIEHNLIFERFLNPERVTLPDIDIDFCYKRRDEVRTYVANKYGMSRVAQIITFGTLAARAVVKDVGRVLGINPSITDRVSKSIPRVLNIKLKDALDTSEQLADMYRREPDIKQIIDIALKLEGFPRNVSIHAAGVVIGDADLSEYVPLQSCDGGMLTQYPMSSLEKIGLLKMDFLGLRNLTIIDDCVEMVNSIYGLNIDINDIDKNDEKTFKMIQAGDTDGVFQLENPGLQTFLRRFKPTKLEDIITTTSIYRPGPMDQIPEFLKNVNSPDSVNYKHPLLKEILEPTFGVVIYQEQVMKIVRSLAGYSMGRADLVRRTMAKKKQDQMKKERQIFLYGYCENGHTIIDGALKRGLSESEANEIFDSLVDFANYAFNKSHAACYALVAYRTAYLKAHWPTCYLASVLQNYAGHTNKAVKYISSFSKYGISVLPPDINKSFTHFSPEGNNVRFGLCWLKNVGDRFPGYISKEREKNGKFTSLNDFIKRMSVYEINKRSVEVLIKCGCFDSIYPNRRVLVCNFERLIDINLNINRTMGEGQLDWFSSMPSQMDSGPDFINENVPDFSKEEKLSFEYEYAGMYFSGHPLEKFRYKLMAFSDMDISQICEHPDNDGMTVNVCGRITSSSVSRTKSGRLIANMKISDFSGECKVIAFEKNVLKYRSLLEDGTVLCINATVSSDDPEKGTELMLNSALLLRDMKPGSDRALYVRIPSQKDFDSIKPILLKYPGTSDVYVYINDTKSMIKSDESHRIVLSDDMLSELETAVGEDNIKIKCIK